MRRGAKKDGNCDVAEMTAGHFGLRHAVGESSSLATTVSGRSVWLELHLALLGHKVLFVYRKGYKQVELF